MTRVFDNRLVWGPTGQAGYCRLLPRGDATEYCLALHLNSKGIQALTKLVARTGAAVIADLEFETGRSIRPADPATWLKQRLKPGKPEYGQPDPFVFLKSDIRSIGTIKTWDAGDRRIPSAVAQVGKRSTLKPLLRPGLSVGHTGEAFAEFVLVGVRVSKAARWGEQEFDLPPLDAEDRALALDLIPETSAAATSLPNLIKTEDTPHV